MSSRHTPFLLAVFLCGFGFDHPLSGHEQKAALTDIYFNERSGSLEIAHRISIHDAEHVLRKSGQKPDDLTDSAKAQSQFAEYVSAKFSLAETNGAAVELSLVGQEIEDGYLWVYQEIPLSDLPLLSFSIQNSILHEEIPGQINTVNIRFGSHVKTFVFSSGSEAMLYERGGE